MKSTAFSTLLLTAVTLIISVPTAARTTQDENDGSSVIKRITGQELKSILQDEGYRVTKVDDEEDVFAKMEGVNVLFLCDENDFDDIGLHVAWTETNATLATVNEWNRTKRFSRAYIDDEGDPHLELDISLTGGVTKDNVVAFIDLCRQSISAFRDEVL